MRIAIAGLMAASLCVTPVLAADAAGPLAPGKPAGVEAARLHVGTGLLIVGGLLVAGLVVAVASSGGSNNTGVLTSGVSSTTTV